MPDVKRELTKEGWRITEIPAKTGEAAQTSSGKVKELKKE